MVAKRMIRMRLPIKKILRPKSIAVVGVSERPEAIGTRVMNNIRKMGFAGPLYAVNPRYETIGELKCYPALSALPEPVDAAFLAVPSSGGPDLVEEAGRCGIRALFINANGYADGGADGVALQRRVEATAAKYGIAICGPNNLGMMNVHDRVAMWSPRYMKVPESGSLGVISQSGSIALILSEDERDLGFAYLITAGNEAVLNIADYLAELAVDDRVEVILLFSETIRDPQKFQAAALKARERGKRIIALKLGSSSEGRALVQAHTGSLAGEDRLYDAYLGLVRLNLASARQVEDAFADLSKRLAKYARPSSPGEIVLQAMAPSGVELIVGIRNEVNFGSFVIVGPGGVLVELANQASVRLGPVDEGEARAMLFETAAGKLLQGARGAPTCDIDAAAAAIAAFSRFGAAQSAQLSALEINPLIASPTGAWGVDLLLDFRNDVPPEKRQ